MSCALVKYSMAIAMTMTRHVYELSRSTEISVDIILYKKQLADAYYLRSKALLSASRLLLAKKVREYVLIFIFICICTDYCAGTTCSSIMTFHVL